MTDLNASPTIDVPSTVIDNDAPAPGGAEYKPDAPAPEPEAAPKPMSLEDAVKQAAAETKDKADKAEPAVKVEPKEAKPKVEAKAAPEPAKATPERAENGKFTAKQAEQEPSGDEANGAEAEQERGETRPSEARDINRAPAHFLPRAKEAWSGVNEDVRAEVRRMEANFEKGIQEHKESHEFRKDLREFDEMAKQHGTTIKAALANYTAIDNELKTNPVGGIERILRSVGITPQQYAQHVLGQEQERQANPQAAQSSQLNQTVQGLQQQIQQMMERDQQREQQTAEQARLAAVEQQFIAPFKAEHERYDELQDDIAFFLNSGKIPSNLSERERLEAAYDMAERINPVGRSANEPLSTAQNAQRPLNPAGSKSVKGSLSYGAEVPRKSAKLSLDEAIKMAARSVNG